MQIPLLIGLLIPLLLAPALTDRIYREAYKKERAQIAVDNAGITLGRADRELLKTLVKLNRLVAALEVAHHAVHLCARIPVTAAACRPNDLLLEAEIRMLHRTGGEMARMAWRTNLSFALAEVARLKVLPGKVSRLRALPLVEKRCRLCFLATRWELAPGTVPIRSVLHASASPGSQVAVGVRLKGTSLEKEWDYRLEPDPEAL